MSAEKKKWSRNCPECGRGMEYSLRRTFLYAVRKKIICRHCSLHCKRPKLYSRICPNCNKDIWHSTKYQRDYLDGSPCKDCSHIGLKYNVVPIIHTPDEYVRSCPKCNTKIIYKSLWKKKNADKYGKICQHCVGDLAVTFRKPFSAHTRLKMRLNKIEKLKGVWGNGVHPNYTPISCEYFEWLNKWNGWNGQYATNGGEYFVKDLGYWVDYYEPKENIVIEWDDPKHYDRYGNLRSKDIIRMDEIKKLLQCTFFRYNGKTKELIKYG